MATKATVMLATGFLMPLSQQGDSADTLDVLSPGVRGYAMEHDGAIYVPVIEAFVEGAGDVGRFLDALPLNRTIRVPCVISERLVGMLRRRGFVPRIESNPEVGDVDVWERAAK